MHDRRVALGEVRGVIRRLGHHVVDPIAAAAIVGLPIFVFDSGSGTVRLQKILMVVASFKSSLERVAALGKHEIVHDVPCVLRHWIDISVV